MKLVENQNLKSYNTFGMEVSARHFLQVEKCEEVPAVIANYLRRDQYYILGGGSNTLFTKDFAGTIVHPAFTGIELVDRADGNVLLRVAAGEPWENLIQYCIKHQLYGIENLTAIPGLVGSAPVQNIGAYGVEVNDSVRKVEGYVISTGKAFALTNAECHFGYRNSLFKQELKNDCIITHVWFQLSEKQYFTLTYQGLARALQERELPLTLRNVSDCVRKIRDSKLPDPKIVGNGGSFFKNPIITDRHFEDLRSIYPDMPYYDAPEGTGKKIPAAWLITKAELKGRSVGGAQIYEKQPLVIVNRCNAQPSDVVELAGLVMSTVSEKFGISLEPEVNYIQ